MKRLITKILPENISRLIKKIYLSIRGLYYYGYSYHCQICDHHFRAMLPGGFDLDVIRQKEIIGAGRRNNNICPYCQSTDRDRLVYRYLSQETDILTKKMRILHVSPEPALYNNLKNRSNIVYVTGTKYSEGIYYHKYIKSIDLLALPFADGEFDIVICNHVLEHIEDDAKAISEIYRVLIDGGLAILQVPISNLLEVTYEDSSVTSKKGREKHFGQFDHLRIYGKDYSNRLENAGFKVQKYSPFSDEYYEKVLMQFALNKKEKLFVAHK